MNIEHLKVFYVLAKEKNFSKTAKALHLSQPSVSIQIRHLEEALNVKLFKRTTKKVDLTHQGKILFETAEKMFSLINHAKKEMALLSETIHGDLVIGASVTLGEHILPYVLGKYNREYPNVNLSMKILNSEQIIEKLKTQQIHLAFIQTSSVYPEFTQKPLMEDELIIIAPNEFIHPGIDFAKQYISPKTLYSLPMILRERNSGTRKVIEQQLRKHKLNPEKLNIVLELENTESIKSAVESGMGISIISKASVQKELRLKTLRQLIVKGISLRRNFCSVYDEKSLTLPGESFLAFIHGSFSFN